MAASYVYPVPNSQLIAAHALQAHFEGGYFAQTVAVSSVPTPSSPSPSSTPALSTAASSAEPSRTSSPTGTAMTAASSSTATLENRALVPSGPAAALLVPAAAKEPAPMYADATQIYYLLTPGSYRGRMHMNLHAVSKGFPHSAQLVCLCSPWGCCHQVAWPLICLLLSHPCAFDRVSVHTIASKNTC